MKRILIILIALAAALPSFGWGRLGHATVAKIAEENLTPTAKKKITEYLHGASIVEYASYADDFKEFLPFEDRESYPHTFEVDMNCEPATGIVKDGRKINNCVYVIDKFSKDLKNAESMPDSLRFLEIVLTVHFVGDMHCPEHMRFYPGDMTIGKYPVMFNGEEITYHYFWDNLSLTVKYPWSFSDLAYLFDTCSKDEIKDIVKGSPYDWARDCAKVSWPFHSIKKGDTLDTDFLLKSMPLAKSQIQKAGYRLAHLLNMTFDSRYARKYSKEN